MWPLVVVGLDELDRPTFPQVVGWLGRAFCCITARARSSCSKASRPPLPPERRVENTILLSVSVDAGQPWCGDGGAEGGEHGRAGDRCVDGDRQRVAGAVVEPGQGLRPD